MLTRQQLNDYLESFCFDHPNLERYTVEEIWQALPAQDVRYAQPGMLADILNDIPYKDIDAV